MQINTSDLQFLVGDMEVLEQMTKTPALSMFSDQAVAFLSELSRMLLKDRRVKAFVDVTSYAYWIRRASLESVKSKHLDYHNRMGRGVAFHIAPSNVPVNFAVSMTSSLLAGNMSLIRVSNKRFEQVDIIAGAIRQLLESKFRHLKPYFCFVRYEHSETITRELSNICDVRIIWGGNRTIEEIRKAPLPPRAIEMTFADRHSIAIINSDEYLNRDAKRVAKGFYTDTYYTDQNACSSPRLVVWTGDKIQEAQEVFWRNLEMLVKADYEMKPIQSVDKYSMFCNAAMADKRVRLVSQDNRIVRIAVERLTDDLMDYKMGGGYFFEYIAKDLQEIIPVLTKQCQTISVLGVGKQAVKQLVFENGVRGVDRIVDLGETMGLEFIWDGYKMIDAMSRFVYTGSYV